MIYCDFKFCHNYDFLKSHNYDLPKQTFFWLLIINFLAQNIAFLSYQDLVKNLDFFYLIIMT